MRYIFVLLITSLFLQCGIKKDKEPGVVSYMKWDSDKNSNFRTFQNVNDTSIITIFISQQWQQINDSTWQFEYLWKNIDSIPINKSVERYTDHTVQLVAQSLFEMDKKGNQIEIPMVLRNQVMCAILSQQCSVDADIHFKLDTAFRMSIHADLNYEFITIDTLPINERDCLVVTSNDRVRFQFSDARKDTILHSVGTRIYSNGRGLIYFSDDDGSNKSEYHLKE